MPRELYLLTKLKGEKGILPILESYERKVRNIIITKRSEAQKIKLRWILKNPKLARQNRAMIATNLAPNFYFGRFILVHKSMHMYQMSLVPKTEGFIIFLRLPRFLNQ